MTDRATHEKKLRAAGEKLRAAHAARDAAIIAASADSAPDAAIAAAVGLSRMQVHRITRTPEREG